MHTQLISRSWRKEPGPRVESSRPLDSAKVQAPCIVRDPSGCFRLFYTAIGSAKPFPTCQGYLLSAFSEDGLHFQKEDGIRVAPQPDLPHISLRTLAPTVTQTHDGRWRMYFEARGPSSLPTTICSAISVDMFQWTLEEGIRLERSGGVGAPRYVPLPDGRGRIYCTESVFGFGGCKSGERLSHNVISAITNDGLHFDFEPGDRMSDSQTVYDSAGITAAEVIPPIVEGEIWTMVYSAWQDVPPGTVVPIHPSLNPNTEHSENVDFATASIASDMAGYRSRIFIAQSADGLAWNQGKCILEGGGHDSDEIDAVHAEDMSLVEIGEGCYRMFYASCDRHGNWRVASAINSDQ